MEVANIGSDSYSRLRNFLNAKVEVDTNAFKEDLRIVLNAHDMDLKQHARHNQALTYANDEIEFLQKELELVLKACNSTQPSNVSSEGKSRILIDGLKALNTIRKDFKCRSVYEKEFAIVMCSLRWADVMVDMNTDQARTIEKLRSELIKESFPQEATTPENKNGCSKEDNPPDMTKVFEGITCVNQFKVALNEPRDDHSLTAMTLRDVIYRLENLEKRVMDHLANATKHL